MAIQIGQWIGVGWTLVLLAATSILGALLLKRESRRAWRELRAATAEGRWPGDTVAQGALILVGGVLLLAPGFVTDVVGLVALLPPPRRALARLLRRWIVPGVAVGGAARRRPGRRGPGVGDDRSDDSAVLDVEVLEVERETPTHRADPSGQPDDDPAGPSRDGSGSDRRALG